MTGKDFTNKFILIITIIMFNSCIKDDENHPNAVDSSVPPEVVTSIVTNVTETSADCGGNIRYDGGAPVIARGVCWSKFPWPSISDFHTVNGSGTGIFTSSITGLEIGTEYYIRAYASNRAGTTYGVQRTFVSDSSLVIGSFYAGGLIFYLDSSGNHGLVCAENNQANNAVWGCVNLSIPGSTGTLVGTGQNNTNAIINGCSQIGIAAKLCDDLVLNGYSDWFLPSKAELLLMHSNLKTINAGNFSNGSYWSSSEMTSVFAWQVIFGTGSTQGGTKSNLTFVRAVRAF